MPRRGGGGGEERGGCCFARNDRSGLGGRAAYEDRRDKMSNEPQDVCKEVALPRPNTNVP